MNILKSIIFDFDGVLVESMSIKADAFRHVFRDFPEHIEKIVKLHNDNGGMPRNRKFEIIYRDFLKNPYTPETGKKLSEEFSACVKQAVINCPFVNGAEGFVKKYHDKVKMFVASGTPHDEMVSIIKARRMDRYFLDVYGSPEDKPAIIKRILKGYGLNPQEAVFIGDSLNDYEGALKTGVRFVGRVAQGEDNPFSQKRGVDGIISDLTGLEECLRRLFPGMDTV